MTDRYGIKFIPCGEQPEVYNIFYTNNDLWLGILYKEIDGYYVWWQNGSVEDTWESQYLRIIADKLDELNYEWDKELREFFAKDNSLSCPDCGNYLDTAQHELGCAPKNAKPWPGFCQNCQAELNPPNATWCKSCGADDYDDD